MAASTRHLARLAAIVFTLTIVGSPAAHAYDPWTNPFAPYYSGTVVYSGTLNLINTSSLYGTITYSGYSGTTNITAGSLLLSGSSTFNYGSGSMITISGATLNLAPPTGAITVLGAPLVPTNFPTLSSLFATTNTNNTLTANSGSLVLISPNTSAGSLAVNPIPEPATLTLAVAAVGLVLATRRMRR
jgi:hypothetical protein